MEYTLRPTATIKVSDLVTEPYSYCDALAGTVRHDQLDSQAADRLAEVLPVAIAQLDAVGDFHGALALAELYSNLLAPLASTI